MLPSLRKGRTESVWPCWPDSVFTALLVPIATSAATAVVTATGTSSWLAPWRHFLGPSLFLRLSSLLPVALFLCLSICSPSHLHRSSKCRSLPLISFSLCLSLSLSWQPHFLSAVLIAASLSLSLSPLWLSIPPLLSLPPCFLLILLSSCL